MFTALATCILVLAFIVIVHEAGHLVIAKLFRVRVHIFSFGFGRRLCGFHLGSTDYRISLIPLGGYIKMAGELPSRTPALPEAHDFSAKPRWARILIALGGPAANITAAILIPALLAMHSHSEPAYLGSLPLVAGVAPMSPAAASGFQPGDLIVAVDDQPDPTWQDVEDHVALNPNRQVLFRVRRRATLLDLPLSVRQRTSDSGSPIGYSGLMPQSPGNSPVIISGIDPASPAALAGLQVGDILLSIGDHPIEQSRFGRYDVAEALRESAGRSLYVAVRRGADDLSSQITPYLEDGKWRLGIRHSVTADAPAAHLGPLSALRYGLAMNWRILRLTCSMIGNVITGDRSPSETLMGPIGVAGVLHHALQSGPITVIQIVGILSLNLGVFNLLPIPILDGGMVFMLLLESILDAFGCSLTLRARDMFIRVGAAILAAFTLFVFANDLARLLT